MNLLTTIGIKTETVPTFEFSISDAGSARVEKVLTEDKIGKFIVMHPGSGGSARDWSIEKFAMLGDALQKNNDLRVVLTGGKNEKDLAASLVSKMTSKPVNYAGTFSLQELAALFKRASVFISNSTGPLHIASIVGTPVVAFYPPIIQCSPKRWGPYTEKKKVFTSDNTKCELCKGGPCQSNICMDQITVDQVLSAVKELLNDNQ